MEAVRVAGVCSGAVEQESAGDECSAERQGEARRRVASQSRFRVWRDRGCRFSKSSRHLRDERPGGQLASPRRCLALEAEPACGDYTQEDTRQRHRHDGQPERTAAASHGGSLPWPTRTVVRELSGLVRAGSDGFLTVARPRPDGTADLRPDIIC